MNEHNTFEGCAKYVISQIEEMCGDRVVKSEKTAERFLNLARLVDLMNEEQELTNVKTNIILGAENCWFDEESWFELTLTDIVIRDGKDNAFFQLITNADFCNFFTHEDNLMVYLGVRGMWVNLD